MVNINAQDRRIQYTGNGTAGPFSFSFQVNATSEIKVYVDTTVKTITTHYTVSLSSDGSGSISFTSGNHPTNSQTITIMSNIPISRTSQFTTGGTLTADALETEFNNQFMHHQQHDQRLDRALSVPEHDTILGADLTLPAKSSRLGKLLGFNSSTGNPEASFTVADGNTLAGISGDIATLADIEDGTDATNAIQTVAGISSNVTSVKNISANVTTVAGISSNVTTVAGISSNVTSVAGIVSDVTAVAGISSDVTAVEDIKTNVTTVAGISANVTTVAGIASNVTSVAGIASNVTTVAGINTTHLSNVSGVASNVAILGTSDAVSDLNTLAPIASDITSLANSLEKTYTVTVANPGSGNVFVLDSSNAPAIEMFRGNTYIFNQNDATNDGHPLVFKNGSSAYEVGVTYFLNGSATTQSNYVNTTTFNAGRSSGDRKVQIEVATSAPSSGLRYYCYVHGNGMGNTITVKDSNISLVAGSIANVNSVGGSLTNVNTVAGSIANVNTVASNVTGVNSFAERYRVGSSEPTSSLDAGDLFFNTSTNELRAYNGSTFQATAPSASSQTNINIVAGEITAQEDLGLVTESVATSSGNNINTVGSNITNVNTVAGISANVTTVAGISSNVTSVAGVASNVTTVANNISGLNSFAERYRVASSQPSSSLDEGDLYYDTTANSLNYYNGSAWVAVVAGAMTSLVVDTTPQLGGNLDVNGNSIVSVSNGDITIAPNGAGEINLNGTVNTDNLTIDFGSIA
ncbi:hypothetical protein [Phenylobacterium sp.]|uniref:hypothetical protein n=1 Tax=Phenylobacterium sp. TaxID=1871053 RepID=UPI0025F86A36|nr:hypothetical protein [Phenylobacterium sp.]